MATRIPPGAVDAGNVLVGLVAERDEVERRIGAQVARVLDAGGSWGTVGAALGVTRQAARQRYGALVASDDAAGTETPPARTERPHAERGRTARTDGGTAPRNAPDARTRAGRRRKQAPTEPPERIATADELDDVTRRLWAIGAIDTATARQALHGED